MSGSLYIGFQKVVHDLGVKTEFKYSIVIATDAGSEPIYLRFVHRASVSTFYLFETSLFSGSKSLQKT